MQQFFCKASRVSRPPIGRWSKALHPPPFSCVHDINVITLEDGVPLASALLSLLSDFLFVFKQHYTILGVLHTGGKNTVTKKFLEVLFSF